MSKGDKIVVSGLSGRYPESNNIEEFWNNLMNGVQMCTSDDRRWPVGFMSLPKRTGKMNNVDKLDHEFFNLTTMEANYMDPQIRVLHETTYEAIWDSGINPEELRGTRTGIYIGLCYSDTDTALKEDESEPAAFHQSEAARLAQAFDFRGPSAVVDTACASTFSALNEGLNALKGGLCDNLIVCGAAFHVRYLTAAAFKNLRMISDDGLSKCLDERADGYCRSEAAVSMLIQYKSKAKRIYGYILSCTTNEDGYKKEGNHFPSYELQRSVMKESIQKANIDPNKIGYIEAHVTGTTAGDPVECKAIMEAYRDNSTKPLLFGCLKSNIGHTEGASGGCSITKALLILQKHTIPPNANYEIPNRNIEGLTSGTIVPVIKPTKFDEDIIPVNTFGFGGVNVHCIIKANEKIITEASHQIAERIPRLINVCGRTEEGVNTILNFIQSNPNLITKDFLALLNDVSKMGKDFGHRGYIVLNDKKATLSKKQALVVDQPLWFLFLNETNWSPDSISFLMDIDYCNDSLRFSAKILKTVDIDLAKLMTLPKKSCDAMSAILVNAAIDIALVGFLKYLGIAPNGAVGYSFGEIIAGYATGRLSHRQTLLVIYFLANYLQTPEQRKNGGYDKLVKIISQIINNEKDNNGNRINGNGPFKIDEALNGSINSCFTNGACISKIHDILQAIPDTGLVIDFGSAPKLLKDLLPQCKILPITKDLTSDERSLTSLLENLGEIYLTGTNPQIELLYPTVEYPVARETASLSPLFRWNHEKNLLVTKYPDYFNRISSVYVTKIDMLDPKNSYLLDHKIDGRVLYPASGYLHLALQQILLTNHISNADDIIVEFRNVKFMRATLLPKAGQVPITVKIIKETGKFYIVEGGAICVTGYITVPDTQTEEDHIFEENTSLKFELNSREVYREFRIRGYDYGPAFKGIVSAASDGSRGQVKWSGNWISFVDSLFQVAILGEKTDFRSLSIPTNVEYLKFDFKKFNARLNSLDGAEPIFEIRNDSICEIGATVGFAVKHLTATPIQRRQNTQTATLEKHVFLPHDEDITSEVNYPHEYEKLCEEQLKTLQSSTAATNEHKEISEDNKGCTGLLNALEKAVAQNLKGSALKEYLLSEKENLIKDPLLNAPLSRLLRPIMDTILENVHSSSMKIVEVVKSGQPGSASIIESLDSLASVYQYSIVCPETSLLKDQSVDSLIEWNVDESTIPLQLTQCDAIIFKDISFGFLEKETTFNLLDFLTSCLNALKDEGFLVLLIKNESLTVEDLVYKELEEAGQPLLEQTKAISDAENAGFTLIGIKNYSKLFSAIFLRKSATTTQNNVELELATEKYDWVPKLQEILKADENNQVWLKSKTEAGVGFVRCLRKEQHGRRVRCVVQNEDPDLKDQSLNSSESSIIKKNLSVNIYNGKKLGTNRHLTFSPDETIIDTKHAYLDIKSKGDLTSLEWREAPHKFWDSLPASSKPSNQFLCNIYYSALNFKDVMVASGRIPLNAYPEGLRKGCAIGMEYSGIDEKGKRIFGLCNSQAIATTLLIHKDGFHFQVPNEWTLEEASTVSTVYLTVYYALILRANLRAGETVLIHAGSGGVGQAAIQVCLSLGCKVYTTVGSEEKKEFLQQRFPQLKDQHFANSRELNFEEHIMRATNGKGVDVILNSLAEEKMRASINCLRNFGRFVEIGKYDLIQNNPMHPSFLTDNKTFQVVCLAHLMHEAFILKSQRAIYRCDKLKELFTRGLQTGQVTPLPTKTFHRHEAEKAFRYMASGKHIGKVVISIRDEHQPSMDLTVKAYAQTWCHPLKSYLIVGGLGGFGLELANWLFTRGAKNIVLSSRSGMKDNFQKLSVERLKSQGVNVIVCTKDASTYEGAVELIEEATKQAPLGGIFNLAMVLKDGFFENQTVDNFEQVCRPKVATTKHLDRITRSKCPQLDYFVCFSSVAAGRGNPGQTNYGFANCFMESVCLRRRNDGLHGLAIQWGPVADVGVVAETMGNEVTLLGTVPQRIPYCLEVMDHFLQSKESVCSSIVRTDGKRSAGSKKQSLVETICHILGVKDYTTLAPTTTLGDLGLDSLMAVEIKQGLERDYDLSLSTEEIRRLSVTDLEDIASKTEVKRQNNEKATPEFVLTNEMLTVPVELFIHLNDQKEGLPVFFFPPIEGDFSLMKACVKYISRPVVGVNWILEAEKFQSISEIASFYVSKLKEHFPQTEYDFVGYSFGAILCFEAALQLQNAHGTGVVKRLIAVDTSPETAKYHMEKILQMTQITKNEDIIITEMMVGFISLFRALPDAEKLKKDLLAMDTIEQRAEKLTHFMNAYFNHSVDANLLIQASQRYYRKLKMLHFYTPNQKFVGDVKLIKSTDGLSTSFQNECTGDYGYSKITQGKVDVVKMQGDHRTLLTNNYEEIGALIDREFSNVSA